MDVPEWTRGGGGGGGMEGGLDGERDMRKVVSRACKCRTHGGLCRFAALKGVEVGYVIHHHDGKHDKT